MHLRRAVHFLRRATFQVLSVESEQAAMLHVRSWVVGALALALGACSSVPYAQRLAQRQSAYAAAAGAMWDG